MSMNVFNFKQNADRGSIYWSSFHEYMNLFNKTHKMMDYALTLDTKYGQWLRLNYKILGLLDTVICNPPGGAVNTG